MKLAAPLVPLEQIHRGQLQAERARSHLLLQKRFGNLPPVIAARIAAAQPPQIESWFERLFEARSLDEIFAAP